jgi:hypothetical protein
LLLVVAQVNLAAVAQVVFVLQLMFQVFQLQQEQPTQ